MTGDDDLLPANTPTFDPSIQSENISFDPAELIACGGCGRKNPPNRLNCLYCARELDVNIADGNLIKPVLRKLELWERGYNLIVRERVSDMPVDKIAMLLSAEPAEVAQILDAGVPLPIVRVESEKEAGLLQSRLGALGLGCSIIPDADLAPDKPPIRLRKIEFRDSGFGLHDFNTSSVTFIDKIDLAILVPGTITTARVDSLEKKRRGGKTKLLDEVTTTADGSVLDIYTRQNNSGYRAHLTGFDFSCLGEDKSLLAVENIQNLAFALKRSAPNVVLVQNYAEMRRALSSVWEVESRKDPQGLQRSGFGKLEFGSVASSNNLDQFTKYSRLQWHLL